MRYFIALLSAFLAVSARAGSVPMDQTSLLFDCRMVDQSDSKLSEECKAPAGYRMLREEDYKPLAPGRTRFRVDLTLVAPGGRELALSLPQVVLRGDIGGPDDLRFGGSETVNWFVPPGGVTDKSPIVAVVSLARVRSQKDESYYAVIRVRPQEACVTALVPLGSAPELQATEEQLKDLNFLERLARSMRKWSRGVRQRLDAAVAAAPVAACLPR